VPHDTSLISTIVISLALAFGFGFLAHRLKLPTIAGYLMAGVVLGPFTPGYVADLGIASQLAELGIVLLMFGVGLHFSVADLLSVKKIAVPGALVQVGVATFSGLGLALMLGWSMGAGLMFGLSLSVASTVVLLRALQEHGIVESERGRIAVGWLIVEDLIMVIALVMIPPLAGLLGGHAVVADPSEVPETARMLAGPVVGALLWTLAKVAVFVLVMLVIGKRVIPVILHAVAHTGSRELFRLAVLAIALGTAFWSAELFGVSLALGAFFAGMVMAGSTLSARAATETLPLRDAFAVLFFVSVGMLFDPAVVVEAPLALAGTLAVILVVKSLAAFAIVRVMGQTSALALIIAVSLAQIGEFSFVLVAMGVHLEVLPSLARDLVVAGALASILLNPLLFRLANARHV
jgi:monovalent cation:H+ antiporter-2, CPA2 family